VLDLKMDKIDLGTDIGALVKINPIYFSLGKALIRADAATELDKIVRVMQENPGMKIELGSHTDARGSDQSNFNLSDKRAKASAAYIVSKGIAPDRITGRGYGESRLVNRCEDGIKCSEEEHQFNRRTEFLVTELGK
jgi:outer membrane protein OmpA-like peptidoglycan-associated protein